MKKKRTIKIKDPRLRKVRYELRRLLQLVETAEEMKILRIKKKLQQTKGFWDSNHPDNKRLQKETQALSSQENDLSYAYNASIASCPVCQEIDKDMTFNPVSREWFCTECYKFNQEFETRQGRPELYP